MSAITISLTKTGHKSASVTTVDGKNFRLHSAFDPVKEAERSTSTFITSKNRIIIIAGCALGYHIQSMKQKYPDNTIIVLEQNREMSRICLEHYPEHLKAITLIHSTNESSALLETMNIASFKGTSVFFHRQSYALHKDFYDHFITDISRYLTSKISDLLTRFEFEQRWVENIMKNSTLLNKCFPATLLFNKFTKLPGLIVSAGPSLRDNITTIKKYQDQLLIVAVDTAYKVLLKHGIEPHIVMVLDAQKQSTLHFFGTHSKQTVLLADIVSSHPVIRDFNNPVFLSTTAKYYDDKQGQLQRETTPFVDWIEKHLIPFGDIQSGGSVATSVFDFLLNAGCPEIILLGQDLAYTGRKIHSSGTHHNEKWTTLINRFKNLETINQAVIRKRKIKYVPSLVPGQTILTDFVLDLYRGWFSDSAKKITIPVINSTYQGAKIEGTRLESLCSLLDNRNKPSENAATILKKIYTTAKRFSTDTLKDAIDQALQNQKKIDLSLDQIEQNAEQILIELEDSGLEEIYKPFLKKTITYLSRHNLSEEKSNKLLLDELRISSKKVSTIFKKARSAL